MISELFPFSVTKHDYLSAVFCPERSKFEMLAGKFLCRLRVTVRVTNRTLANSLPGTFVPWPIRSLELSLLGAKWPGNFRSLEFSFLVSP